MLKDIKFFIRGERPTSQYIKAGMKVGCNFQRQQGCHFDYSHCWLITIGDNVTVAPNVLILAHDASIKSILGYTKIGCVNVGNNVFIGANSIILPNIKIGDNVIIGANSTVSRDLEPNSVYAGNPAKYLCSLDEYIEKNKSLVLKYHTYDSSFTIRSKITNNQKEIMKKDLENRVGFVE